MGTGLARENDGAAVADEGPRGHARSVAERDRRGTRCRSG